MAKYWKFAVLKSLWNSYMRSVICCRSSKNRLQIYGERTDDAVVDVPMNVFTIDGVVQKDLLVPGNEIPMRDNVGRPMNGVVVSVDESQNTVRMDFNSPLAGVTLYFSGKIESVREATEDEKQNGIRRGCGGNCGGGCGGDSCGGNSCGGCGDDEGCCGGCH